MKTLFLTIAENEISRGVSSGQRVSHFTGPSRQFHRYGLATCTKSCTARMQYEGPPPFFTIALASKANYIEGKY